MVSFCSSVFQAKATTSSKYGVSMFVLHTLNFSVVNVLRESQNEHKHFGRQEYEVLKKFLLVVNQCYVIPKVLFAIAG